MNKYFYIDNINHIHLVSATHFNKFSLKIFINESINIGFISSLDNISNNERNESFF